MHVPANVPVRVRLESEDVIHSFYLPDLRLKQDAVPGMTMEMWFEATQPGEYVVGCAELCGLGHYRMKGSMIAHAEAEFQQWNTDQQQRVAAAQAGGTAPVAAAPAATTTSAGTPATAASHNH
jgi:cytochrome c oxidase subunit 2